MVGKSSEDISDCKTFPWQPNFGQNRLKSCRIGANLSYT